MAPWIEILPGKGENFKKQKVFISKEAATAVTVGVALSKLDPQTWQASVSSEAAQQIDSLAQSLKKSTGAS